ncbi:MAG TPA: hypothetical protein VMU92_11585 [Acidobacteriaceae bacterium]|nr:hypothetical protein [Acidobacteriaceae bacterium]
MTMVDRHTPREQIREEQMREDANEVLNKCISYAKKMMRRYGAFAPFGYRMNGDGQVALEVVRQHGMPPEPVLLLDLLNTQLRERTEKGLLLAAATASNVTMDAPSKEGFTDAVMVDVEHCKGYSMRAYVPYRITGGQWYPVFPRVVKFGMMQVHEIEPKMFRQE